MIHRIARPSDRALALAFPQRPLGMSRRMYEVVAFPLVLLLAVPVFGYRCMIRLLSYRLIMRR